MKLLRTFFGTLIVSALLGPVVSSSQAWAVTALKKVAVSDGQQLDLLFDGKLAKNQIKTEFFNDTIQISLNDVSVYPAKIFAVSGPELTKVFAYQYAPKLVRCRLTVKGKAENFKDRVAVDIDGKMVTVRLVATSNDRVAHSSAQATRPAAEAEAPAQRAAQEKVEKPAPAPAEAEAKLSADEKILLEKVLKSPAPEGGKARGLQLTSAKAAPSLFKGLGMLMVVLAAFGACALMARKLKTSRRDSSGAGKKLNGMLGRLVGKGFGGRDKVIDVVATHHLGPKKSITVVKISGKLLVLGVSGESINLISQLPDTSASDAERAMNQELEAESRSSEGHMVDPLDSLGLEDFLNGGSSRAPQGPQLSTTVQSQPQTQNQAQPQAQAPQRQLVVPGYGAPANARTQPASFTAALQAQAPRPEAQGPSVRDRIKNRVQGMKQL